ncbi:MAG: hypothetical protein QW561_01965 [Candidatus Aenigmatarchaeota archaeon]
MKYTIYEVGREIEGNIYNKIASIIPYLPESERRLTRKYLNDVRELSFIEEIGSQAYFIAMTPAIKSIFKRYGIFNKS